MKIYVISDDKEKGAHFYSEASMTGCAVILSPNFYGDYRLVVNEVIEKRGLFDVIFILTKSPIPLSVDLNKIGWVRAAVCSNGEEASESREAMSNIILINSKSLSETHVDAIIKNSLNLKIKHSKGMQESLIEVKKEQFKNERPVRKRIAEQKQAKEERKQEDREEDYADGKKRPLKERLKRSLGLGE